jgi:transposase
MSTRYTAEVRAKSVRLFREHSGDYPSEWAAIKAISGRMGMNAETLRKWIRRASGQLEELPGDPILHFISLGMDAFLDLQTPERLA